MARIVRNFIKPVNYSAESQYDAQGDYWWSLVHQAGWDYDRVTRLLLSKYKATHWNALSDTERRGAIAMMKKYADKSKIEREKKLRQRINAIWITGGYTREELHDLMLGLGYGDKLRDLKIKKLLEILTTVQEIVNKPKGASK